MAQQLSQEINPPTIGGNLLNNENTLHPMTINTHHYGELVDYGTAIALKPISRS